MKITMIAFGSTGDVQPYIVLGRELKARGHDIAICAFPEFETKVLNDGFRFFPIRGDVQTFMSKCLSGAFGVVYLKQVIESMEPHIKSILESWEEACADAEAIISVFFGEVIMSIAEMRHIPYIQTQYYPMDSNGTTPIPVMQGQKGGRIWNLMTYQLGYLLISLIEKYFLADWRAEKGMSPRKISKTPNYEINGHQVPVLYIMSPLIMRRPRDWGENIHMTGYLLEKDTKEFTPSPELQAFLTAKPEPPIYIGFGSMVSNDMGQTLSIVLDAIDRAGVRAIISKGWGGILMESRENVFVVDYVPHDWLFKQVSAVVHHGGAGTTAAGILAGKPTLIIPFGGDQPFWGQRIKDLGVGPKPIPRAQLNVRNLSKALSNLVNNKRYTVAAKELGSRLALENGAKTAADLVEHELRKWLRQEGRDAEAMVPKHE